MSFTRSSTADSSGVYSMMRPRGVVDLDGKPFNFPKPNGISGAPLWELQKPAAGGRKVVGVMIEHRRHAGVFIATDIAAVLLMLRDYYEATSKRNASEMNGD